MAVTLKDIAEQTGVSPSVVSTVLSGRDNGTFVSEGTRRKVLQVAEALNYTPVRSGRPRGSRRLRRQHTERFIGAWDAQSGPASSYITQCLQTALSQHAVEDGAGIDDDYGLRLLLGEDLPRLDALGILGMVLLAPVLLPREAAAATIPCAMLGEVDHPPRELMQVHLDNHAAGCTLADYLWGLGHRHIVLLAPSTQVRVGRLRWQGLQSTWSRESADPNQVIVVAYDVVKSLSEREQVRRTLQRMFGPETPLQSLPTALVCPDETVAAIAGQTLAELGRRVPHDISLACFSDTPGLAESLTPALTTIQQPVPLMAAAIIEQIFLLHDAPDPNVFHPVDLAFPGKLVVRSSCAPPGHSH